MIFPPGCLPVQLRHFQTQGFKVAVPGSDHRVLAGLAEMLRRQRRRRIQRKLCLKVTEPGELPDVS